MKRPVIVVGVLVLGACSTGAKYDPHRFTPVEKMTGEHTAAEWATANDYLLGAFPAALGAVADAAGDYDLHALAGACGRIGVLAGEMLDRLPIPDKPEASEHMTAAMEHYEESARLCVEGIDTGDVDTISRSTDETNAATAEATLAAEALTR